MSNSVGWIISLSDGARSLYFTAAAPPPDHAGAHWFPFPRWEKAWTYDRSLAYPFDSCQAAEKVMQLADLQLLHHKRSYFPMHPYPDGSATFTIMGEDFPFRPDYQLQIMCVYLTGGKPSNF